MKIIIIDDDVLVTAALKMILEADEEITVSAVGSDGAEALPLYRQFRPDVLLTDIRMKNMSGLAGADQVLQEFPDAKILLLTTFLDDEYIIKALRSGVKGYLIKQDYESIAPALKAVVGGQVVFGNEIVSRLPGLMTKKAGNASLSGTDLTEREKEAVRLIADGLSNREIAQEMYLGEGTVRNLVSSILDKLSLRDRTQIAVYYYKHGF